MSSQVGPLLRRWRDHRQLSQLSLASEAGVSQRHLSFVETGRARPSRELVLHLARALDVPLRERNSLLQAAGFAPVWNETPLDDPAMAPVRHSIDLMLAAHDPLPAVVIDRWWDVVQTNEGGARLIAGLLPPDTEALDGGLNLMRLACHPEGLRSLIVNWDEVATELLGRFRRQVDLYAGDDRMEAMLEELEHHVGPSTTSATIAAVPELVIPIHLRVGDLDVRVFSTLATVGSATDVTVQELVIEMFFGADDASDAFLRGDAR